MTWEESVESSISAFCKRYSATYARTDRQLYASFEIGCFLSLVELYSTKGFKCEPRNLTNDGAYRYLTTPSGNPRNFSFMHATLGQDECEIRQQIRIRSHLNHDITFTPDIVVTIPDPELASEIDSDYALGKRRLFCIHAENLISAHECKSTAPFPELLISFLGMLVAGHSWLDNSTDKRLVSIDGNHLAPTLFVGGYAKAFHRKMISALSKTYPMNVVSGMHEGTWTLENPDNIFINTPPTRP